MTEPGSGPVECYSGHTYAQEPRAFFWQGGRFEVLRVLERWRTPDGPAFRLEVAGEKVFELHYLESEERWTIRCLSEQESWDRERERSEAYLAKDKEIEIP